MSPGSLRLVGLLAISSLAAWHPRVALAEEPIAARDAFAFFEREDVVRAATGTEERPEEAPSVVTVFDRETSRKRGLVNVGQMLGEAAGVSVFHDWVAYNIGIRGTFGGARAWGSVLKVMIDGRDAVFRPYGAHFLGPELVPMLAVKRVELVRGPLSALYGADAFLGIADVVTIDGAELRGAAASVEGSVIREGAAVDAQAVVGDKALGIDFLGAVSWHLEERSGLPLPDTSPRYAQFVPEPGDGGVPRAHGDDATALSAFGKAKVKLGSAGLSVDGSYHRLRARASFLDYGALQPRNQVGLHHGGVRLRFEQALGERVSVSMAAGPSFARPTSDNLVDLGSSRDFVAEKRFSSSAFEANAQARIRALSWLRLTVGGDYTHDHEVTDLIVARYIRDAAPFRAGDTSIIKERDPRWPTVDLDNAAGFLQVDARPIEALRFVGGLRLDEHSLYGTQASYRAGLVAQGSPAGVSLFGKLLYGTAFKAPTPLQLFGQGVAARDQRGNDELKPQKAGTGEAVLGAVLGGRRQVTLTTTLFRTVVDDQVEFDFRSMFEAFNVARSTTHGVEAEAALRHRVVLGALGPLELRGTGNFTWLTTMREFAQMQANFIAPEDELFPAWIVRAGLSGELLLYRLSGYLRGELAGARKASFANIAQRLNQAPYELPGWGDLSTGASLDLLHRVGGQVLRVDARGENLLENRKTDPGFGGVDIPARGRTLTLGVTYTY